MKRLGVYPISLQKIINRTHPDIGAYGGRVTDGDGDDEGNGYTISLKNADTSDSRSVSGGLTYC